jgi:predicted phage baseplate assembly protein
MVKPGQLGLLLTRPLGVRGVTNPLAPVGADDAETRDQARQNAPSTVLTFDRVVSLADFEHFARAFGGIAKAQAASLWRQGQQSVVVTVAGAQGAALAPRDPLLQRLRSAIRKAGATLTAFDIHSYEKLVFALRAEIIVTPDYLADKVLKEVRATLEDAFSFDRRNLGQSIDRSQVIGLIQAVAGVETVNLTRFHLAGPGRPAMLADRLAAHPGRRTAGGGILPAQLIIVDPAQIEVVNVTVFGK